MKLSFISFIIALLLFSGCRNSFLIKKRYSKGFYIAHSSKIKTERIVFSSDPYDAVISQEHITKKDSDLKLDHCCSESSIENHTPAFNVSFKHPINIIDRPNKILKHFHKISYNDNGPKRHIVSCITLVVILAMLMVLAKVFGLLYIIPVSFIIAFTALSIFFIIRTHLN